jgi:predicted RNase H-like nuclease (RuvC/YqgF family)
MFADENARLTGTITQLTHQNNQLRQKIAELDHTVCEYRDNIALMQANLVAQ